MKQHIMLEQPSTSTNETTHLKCSEVAFALPEKNLSTYTTMVVKILKNNPKPRTTTYPIVVLRGGTPPK